MGYYRKFYSKYEVCHFIPKYDNVFDYLGMALTDSSCPKYDDVIEHLRIPLTDSMIIIRIMTTTNFTIN